jgi:NAD(P)-dependent dehydrogenase (short-subunit alcohol dehydrogenase family)
METFDGRDAVVTGASTGIGRAIASSLAAQGMKIPRSQQREHRHPQPARPSPLRLMFTAVGRG